MTRGEPEPIGRHVQAFYDALPFNHWGSVESAVAAGAANPLPAQYPDLHALLLRTARLRLAEFGCGAGWLACAVARHYGHHVTAVDFSAAALARATALAEAAGVARQVAFVQQDLFGELPAREVDVVVSMGVLHHTGAARRAFTHIQAAARAGGHVYLGLYHGPGRRIFLDHFAAILAEQGEPAAYARFRELCAGRGSDEEHLRSWFRDQVMHPHETQHTLREVVGWLRDAGLELLSTSINRFAPIDRPEVLFAQEQEYAELSRRALFEQRRFFPGFFTVLARKV